MVLQSTYRLCPLELSNGLVNQNRGSERLDLDDLLNLALVAMHHKFVDSAVDFMRAAKARVNGLPQEVSQSSDYAP